MLWTVTGTTWDSGAYRSKKELVDKAFGPLLGQLDGSLTVRIVDMAAEGAKLFLHFESTGPAKNGVLHDQDYCWAMVMRGGRILEITAYLDTDLLLCVMELTRPQPSSE